MTPNLRKLALAIHLITSVGWIGAVIAYLALGLSAANSTDAEIVRAAWIAMERTGWSAIVPLAIGSLLTGLAMSLGTPWGLFRHYWVLITLALTIVCVTILLVHMPMVSAVANVARVRFPTRGRLGSGDLLHPGLGLVVLVVITVLNVYKPAGVTPYGWRKQREKRRSEP